MATLPPAPGAEPYQRVTQAQVDELARLFAAAVDALAAAGSGAAIDRIVADLQVEVERLENSLDVAAQTLPLAAGRAILAADRCGDLLG